MFVLTVLMFLQIVGESLPVSSSGHTLLFRSFAQWCGWGDVQLFDAAQAYDYFFHGPTLAIVAFLFYRRWMIFLRHPWRTRKMIGALFLRGLIVESITIGVYLLLDRLSVSSCLLVPGFAITCLALLSLRWCPRGGRSGWSAADAVVLGCVQAAALLPGISRLACTYAAGRWLGLNERTACETSLLIQWPLIAVGWLKGMHDLYVQGILTQVLNPPMLLVMLLASGIAACALHWVQRLMYRGQLWWFGIYMVLPLLGALRVMTCRT